MYLLLGYSSVKLLYNIGKDGCCLISTLPLVTNVPEATAAPPVIAGILSFKQTVGVAT